MEITSKKPAILPRWHKGCFAFELLQQSVDCSGILWIVLPMIRWIHDMTVRPEAPDSPLRPHAVEIKHG